MNPENMKLSETSQINGYVLYDYIYVECPMPRIGKSIKIESRLAAAKGGGRREQGLTANRYTFFLGGDATLKLDNGNGCTVL